MKAIATVSLFLLSTFSVASFGFPSGAGTKEDPYLIHNCAELQSIIGFPSEHFILANNIDCSGFDYGDGGGFMPIGDMSFPFKGSLDGNHFAVSALNINRPSKDNVGLIGYLNAGVVKNLAVTNSAVIGRDGVGGILGDAASSAEIDNIYYEGTVSGNYSVGGLIGSLVYTKLTNSHASAFVTSSAHMAGGLTGYAHYSDIINCSSEGEVQSTYANGSEIGGLVGSAYGIGYSVIEKSFSNNIVKGVYSIGGLIGEANGYKINNNYAAGEVYGHDYLGGLIGTTDGYDVSVTHNYAAALVKGNIYAGGLIGYNKTGVITINNSYWDTIISGQPFSAGGTPKTTTEMYQQATYLNWDFVNIWEIDQGVDYPRLPKSYTSRIGMTSD